MSQTNQTSQTNKSNKRPQLAQMPIPKSANLLARFKPSRAQFLSAALIFSAGMLAFAAVPNVFTSGATISSAAVNDNFSAQEARIAALEAKPSVTSVVDRFTGPAGSSVTSVPESSLTALPVGATTRRVMVLNAVLRPSPDEIGPILGVFHAFIGPTPVAGAYPVTVWDPASGTEFTGSGLDVVHLYVASYFSD